MISTSSSNNSEHPANSEASALHKFPVEYGLDLDAKRTGVIIAPSFHKIDVVRIVRALIFT